MGRRKKIPKVPLNDKNQEKIEKKNNKDDEFGLSKWTSKTPVTQLSELCRKKRWEQPEYRIKLDKEGNYSGHVLIKAFDKVGSLLTKRYQVHGTTKTHQVSQFTNRLICFELLSNK